MTGRAAMRVRIEADAAACAGWVAAQVAARVASRADAVLGLAAGRTMVPVYAELARRHREQGLSLRRATAFLLDEYHGLGRADPRSFHAFVTRHLVATTDLPPAALHAPDGLAADPHAEALRYEAALRDAGGVDLQLLGIGGNGHLGFNEPGAALDGRVHVAELAPATRAANRAALAAGPGPPPHRAITLGLGNLLEARTCLLVAFGAAKAAAVAAAVEGAVTPRVPASVLQRHPDATLVLDPSAAARLHAARAPA